MTDDTITNAAEAQKVAKPAKDIRIAMLTTVVRRGT